MLALSDPPFPNINQLEEKTGVRLFVRTTRSVNLTPLGVSFLTSARQLLRKVRFPDGGSDRCRDPQAWTSHDGLSPIGCFALDAEDRQGERELYRNVQITIGDTHMRGITSALISGEADLGIGGRAVDHAELTSAVVARDRKSIRGHELLVGGLVLLDRAMEDNDLMLSIVAQVTNISTLMGMIEEAVGISALPSLVVPRASGSLVRSRPITDPVLTRTIRLYWKRGQGLSPAAQAIIKALIHAVGSDAEAFNFPDVEWDLEALKSESRE